MLGFYKITYRRKFRVTPKVVHEYQSMVIANHNPIQKRVRKPMYVRSLPEFSHFCAVESDVPGTTLLSCPSCPAGVWCCLVRFEPPPEGFHRRLRPLPHHRSLVSVRSQFRIAPRGCVCGGYPCDRRCQIRAKRTFSKMRSIRSSFITSVFVE